MSVAGLVPLMALARRAGLAEFAGSWLSVPTDKGANAGLKVTSLVAGMAAGADSIDDMAVLCHGGMARVLGTAPAPSTLGSFLRAMTFGTCVSWMLSRPGSPSRPESDHSVEPQVIGGSRLNDR